MTAPTTSLLAEIGAEQDGIKSRLAEIRRQVGPALLAARKHPANQAQVDELRREEAKLERELADLNATHQAQAAIDAEEARQQAARERADAFHAARALVDRALTRMAEIGKERQHCVEQLAAFGVEERELAAACRGVVTPLLNANAWSRGPLVNLNLASDVQRIEAGLREMEIPVGGQLRGAHAYAERAAAQADVARRLLTDALNAAERGNE